MIICSRNARNVLKPGCPECNDHRRSPAHYKRTFSLLTCSRWSRIALIVPPPRPGSRASKSLPPGRLQLHWTQIPGSAIVVQDKAYAIGQAVEAGRIDAVIFPTWAQLPVINGDRNSQLVADLKPSQNLC